MLLLLQGKGLEDCLQRRVSLALIIRYIMTKALMFCVQKAFCIAHGFGPKRLQVLRRKLESGNLN